MDPAYRRAASEWLRAIRGHRSQVAFARRLGYRGNPITDWENGRRYPTATETLRACARVGIDVTAAFARFHSAAPYEPGALHRWLDALRGGRSRSALGRRLGRSRFAISRWLTGEAEPRLPDFLALVDVLTGRAPELVASFVLIEEVPTFVARARAARAAATLAIDEPWSEAVLRVLEIAPRERPATADDVAARLRLSRDDAARALERLAEAGVVERVEPSGWAVVGELNVDTKTHHHLQRHWSQVVAGRCADLGEGETFGYNVMSLARDDLPEVREILRRAYRDIRSLAASSEPRESVALVGLALVRFDDEARFDDHPR